MKKIAILSCIISTGLAFAIVYFVYFDMSRSNRSWGMYGVAFLELGLLFGVVGVVLICFTKTKENGKGVLLSGLLLLLFGSSVCSGMIRF